MSTILQQAASGADDGWRTWAPVGSAIVAAVAFLVSLSNRATAKKALRLSETQENRRAARLDLSMTEGVSWRPPGEPRRWIGMHVLAVNPTDRDGSLVGADLHVTYTTADGDPMMVKVPHGPAGTTLPGEIVALEIPMRLPSNGAVAGWLVFKLDDGVVGGGEIDRYDGVVRDSRGLTETLQAWVLREIVHGQAP